VSADRCTPTRAARQGLTVRKIFAEATKWRYTHIHEEVLSYLREHGVTDEQIETMLVTNPRRYLETAGLP
jgi:predicted metal-dependent phosphotriesterase family hydrolase